MNETTVYLATQSLHNTLNKFIVSDHSQLGKFLCKNTSMSTFSGLWLDLSLFTISPLAENILSAGTDVAGIHRICLATLDRM